MRLFTLFLLLLRRLIPMRLTGVQIFMVTVVVLKALFRARQLMESQAAAAAAAQDLNLIEEGVRRDEPTPEAVGQPAPDSSPRRLTDRELMQAFLGIFQNAIEILSSLSEQSPSLRGELTQFFRQSVADEIQLLMADEQERRTAQTDHVIIDIIDSEEAETEPPSSSPVINGSGTEQRNQNERAAQVEDRIIHRGIEMTIPSFNPLPFMPNLRAGSSLTNFTGESSAARSRGAAKETDEEGTGKRKKA